MPLPYAASALQLAGLPHSNKQTRYFISERNTAEIQSKAVSLTPVSD